MERIDFGPDGLVPTIVQDAETGEVLTLAYMNREALKRTILTGETHFWSRSRRELWHKGATSGNVQRVREMRLDCDGDALLVLVERAGPACHTGAPTCFHRSLDGEVIPEAAATVTHGRLAGELSGVLERLYDVIVDRRLNPKEGAYTCELFDAGLERILKKLGEEAVEVMLAAMADDEEQVVYECADLLYHLLVLLGFREIGPAQVLGELDRRFGAPPRRAAAEG